MRAMLIIMCLLPVIVIVASCQNEQQVELRRYYSAGAMVYQAHCQNCHGDKGQGLAALIPSLTDTLFLKTNKKLLACYLQYGLTGKIRVNKREYEGKMPVANLSPIEIAQVLTYVSNSFGNKNGLINTDNVEHDLKDCK